MADKQKVIIKAHKKKYISFFGTIQIYLFGFTETFTADEKKLYERITALLDDEDTFIDLPGMYPLLAILQCHSDLWVLDLL